MRVTGTVAFSLFKLKKELKQYVDFQGEEQDKLVKKYGGEIADNGMIMIADAKKKEEFDKADRELGEMECEITPVRIPAGLVPDITLAEIEALDGFVEFTEE
jgi:hypothetical protein